jgi:hypothetical protein
MDLLPAIDDGDKIVAVSVLAPTVPVRVKLLKVASPEEAFTVVVPEIATPLAVITTCWLESEPVVTRFASES